MIYFKTSTTQIFIGIIVGYIFCKIMYNKEKEFPNFAPTISLLGLNNGHQKIYGVRIHHWMWGVVLLSISIYYNLFIIIGFSFSILIHGLSYKDCFDFT